MMSEQMNHRQHLNRAKKLVEAYQNSFDKDMALGHAQALMRNHVKSLIIQAERVQELEEEVEFLSHSFGIEAERAQELERELSDADENAVAFESLWLEVKSRNEHYEQILKKIKNTNTVKELYQLWAKEALEESE